MGIPYYFYNLTQKYKDIITKKIPENPEIYAIDFNGIIHPIAAKIIKEKGNEDKIIEELWKKIDEIKYKAIDLHSWMKAFLFTDALIFHEEDNEMAFTILNQIITSDTLLCKNDLMIAVTTTVFEADLIGVDELEPLLDDMDDLDIKIKED